MTEPRSDNTNRRRILEICAIVLALAFSIPAGMSSSPWTAALLVAVSFLGLAHLLNRQPAVKSRAKAQPLEPAPPPPEPKPAPILKESQTFYCTTAGAEGRGRYTEKGFLVLEGSRGPKDARQRLDSNLRAARDELVGAGVIQERDGSVFFTCDHLFQTPSAAVSALLGKTANGWLEWKTRDGTTLETLERLGPRE